MNVADAIASTSGASAAPATPADAGAGAFGALIDRAANDAGADVAATGKPVGGLTTDGPGALVRLPVAAVRWSGLAARSTLVGVSSIAPNGGAPDASSSLAPVDRGLAATAMTAGPTPGGVGGQVLAPSTVATAATIEASIVAGDTPTGVPPAASVPRVASTPSSSAQTAEPIAALPAGTAAKSLAPRDLTAAAANTANADARSDATRTVLAGGEGTAKTSLQEQPDGPDALPKQSASPTTGGTGANTTAPKGVASLPTRAGPLLATLVADAGNAQTLSSDAGQVSPAAPAKVKTPADPDTGEPQDMPPAATAAAMQVDPSVAAIVAAVPTPSAPISPVRKEAANASPADSDRVASASPSPAAATTGSVLRNGSRPDDVTPPAATRAHDGLASASPLPLRDTTPAAIAQPQATANAAPVVAAQPGRIGREVGVQIARHVTDGKSEVTIRLDPANMGRIDVRLSFDDTGRLTAAVHADNPASLAMLRSEASDLGRSLTDAGIRADVSAFSFDSRHGGGGAGGFGQPGQQHPRLPQADARYAAGQAADDDRLSFRSLRTSDRVDLIA